MLLLRPTVLKYTVGRSITGHRWYRSPQTGRLAATYEDIEEHLKKRFPNASFSKNFINQMMEAFHGSAERFGDKYIYVDFHSAIKAIDELEHNTGKFSKGPSQFDLRDEIIGGLWHKHWFQASFMTQNMEMEFKRKADEIFYKKLEEQTGYSLQEGIPPEKWIPVVVHLSTTWALEERAKRKNITGEWIIFKKNGTRNIYLSLATHRQGKLFREDLLEMVADIDAQC